MVTKIKKRPKKKLGTYPSVSVILSITLALFVLGLFGLLIIHTNNLTRMIKENVEVQIYLQKEITNAQKTKIQKTLGSDDYVLTSEGQPEIIFVSKEEAAEEFEKSTGENFSEFLGDNPLRDLFRVKIKPEYQQSDSMQWITSSVESMGGVYEVVYVQSIVDSINRNITKISLILIAFASLLVLIVILLINNTIKLALFSQRFLIRSMQLVGATSSFIRLPFIKRAIGYGIISSVISSVSLYGVTQYAYAKIEDLKLLGDQKTMLILLGIILLAGLLLATMSTYQAVSKYLKMSLDDLY